MVDTYTTDELSKKLGMPSTDVISKLVELGWIYRHTDGEWDTSMAAEHLRMGEARTSVPGGRALYWSKFALDKLREPVITNHGDGKTWAESIVAIKDQFEGISVAMLSLLAELDSSDVRNSLAKMRYRDLETVSSKEAMEILSEAYPSVRTLLEEKK